MKMEHREKAEICKALGHPIRFCIVEGLLSGERNVSEMVQCTDVPQPTVSQHLNILKAAGIIECHRDGNKVVYRVCSGRAARLMKAMAR
jgi:ArsR family transcriptional regulator